MCIVTQWLRKWRAQRQLLEERKAEAEKQAQHKEQAEREKHAQREKQDYEYGQGLRLILQGLQDVMDPLIASQAYNDRFCPLTRLPEELLLDVLDLFRGDDVTLYCLRWTSRIFRRLLHQQSGFWSIHACVYSPCSLHCNEILNLRRLVEKDRRCDNCRSWNARQRHPIGPCEFVGSYLREKPIFMGREYWWTDYSRPYCSACDTDHDACEFPMAYRQPPRHQDLRPQICLGQLGSVKLCEHIYITWATVKSHIDAWRRPRGEGEACTGIDWKACVENFSIECHDATHDIRCTDAEAPSWPRARLETDLYYVFLYLEWTPHGRIDVLMPTTDGKIPAARLRDLFRKFRRQGPADSLYPPGFPETLPEMACFRHDFPIYYKIEEEGPVGDKSQPSPSLLPSEPLNPQQLSSRCQSLTWSCPIGLNSQGLDITPHHLSGASGPGIASQCLAVRYQKGILICHATDLEDPAFKLIPSHTWLHAMETQTYPHQEAGQFRPRCKDESCTNYYLRAKDDHACSLRF